MTVGIASSRAQSFLETLRGVTYTGIATPFIQLHTADPGAAGTTGISAGSTTRNAISWNAFSAGSITLLSVAAWTNAATTETLTHISIWTASTAGTFVQSILLTTPQPWVATNQFNLNTCTLSATPIAA